MAATGFLYGCSFDYYTTADRLRKWTTENILNTSGGTTTMTVTSSAARNGPNGLRVAVASQQIANYEATWRKTLAPGDATTCVIGVAFRYSQAQATGIIGLMGVLDAGTVQCQLALNLDGTLSVVRGTTRTSNDTILVNVLGTTSAALQARVNFYHIKWKVVISPTNGSTDIWLNNINVLHATGLNTQATAHTSWNQVAVGVPFCSHAGLTTGSWTATNFDYDDLTCWDQNYSGSDLIGLACHAQSGNGAHTDWTPSSGSDHGDMVKDVTSDDDVTYNATSGIGDIDTYAMDDVPAGAQIRAVQAVDVVRKDDAGDRTIANVFRIGGVDYVGADLAPNQTYSHLLTPYTVSPATGLAFTESEFDAMEAGVKVTG